MRTWPVIVLGGSGYVAGELLRIIAQHPQLELAGAVSSSQPGEPIGAAFGHLAGAYAGQSFVSLDAAIERLAGAEHSVLLSAAPHGAAAQIIDRLLDAAEAAGVKLTVVDASADFRFRDAGEYAEVYGHAHAAPARLAGFSCAVPEQLPAIETPHAAHPGCFATSMLLGIVPLAAAGLVAGDFYVSAVTGSTGAGRKARDTTHHPMRHDNLFAYQVLRHRHAPEVRRLAEAAAGRPVSLRFVPQSGPFARGIYTTVFAARAEGAGADDAVDALRRYYDGSPFVRVLDEPPKLKDVVAGNDAALSVATDGAALVVHCALDNLVKGAAGGSVQWANRLLGLPEATGLTAAAPGWV